MCGIFGVMHLDHSPVDPEAIRRSTDLLAHRGPDGSGAYVDDFVGIGHRRLAIIDLSESASQPMRTPDGRFTITYNGELYNFRELRKELEASGFQFRSQSDTEVILYAYAHWGRDCVIRFNGMFAFAIYDQQNKEVFLARDRHGVKPLYLCRSGNIVAFASEAKAILAYPGVSATLDREALLEYFTFQNLFTDKTLFQNIELIQAGTYATLDLNDLSAGPKHHRYWDYDFRAPEKPLSDDEYLEKADFLFSQAVNRQLVSDTEVGSYLSGGMDSGSIAAIAARELPNMKSFTCGFDMTSASGMELNFDERRAAERMSYVFQTEHYEMVLKAGDMERVLPRLAYHLEEPRIGQSYPNFYAAQLAGKFVKVVLSGVGGDELFGGYPWRYYRAVVNDDFEHYIDKYYVFWQRLIPNKEIHRVFAPIWEDVAKIRTRDIFSKVFKHHANDLTSPEEYLNHSMYFEAKTFLHGLLVVEDKLSMAHSLETRVPFLDNDLVDFAMQLPAHLKLGNLTAVVKLDENEPGAKTAKYFQKTQDGKLLLRKMMARYIPTEVTEREKQGFSAPDASWFKGESIDFVRDRLLNRNARIYEYISYDDTARLINEHLDGKVNRRLLLWSLLNVEEFLKAFFSDSFNALQDSSC